MRSRTSKVTSAINHWTHRYISWQVVCSFQSVLLRTPSRRIATAQTSTKTVQNKVTIVPIIMERAKCYLLLKELNMCLKDMQRVVDSGDERMLFDFNCLESLREASKNTPESF